MALVQVHHIISQALAKNNPLLRALQEFTGGSQFDVNAEVNRIELPATRELAVTEGQQVGAPDGSISPHNGGPLNSYEGILAADARRFTPMQRAGL